MMQLMSLAPLPAASACRRAAKAIGSDRPMPARVPISRKLRRLVRWQSRVVLERRLGMAGVRRRDVLWREMSGPQPQGLGLTSISVYLTEVGTASNGC